MRKRLLVLAGCLAALVPAFADTITFSEGNLSDQTLLSSGSTTSAAFSSYGITLTLCGSLTAGPTCVPLTSMDPNSAGTVSLVTLGNPTGVPTNVIDGQALSVNSIDRSAPAVTTQQAMYPVTLLITFNQTLMPGTPITVGIYDTECSVNASTNTGLTASLTSSSLTTCRSSVSNQYATFTFSNAVGVNKLFITDTGADGLGLDNLTFTPSVPEPGTFGLLGASLIGIGLIGYRRRRASGSRV
jgi:hypothetical protein